MEDLFIYEVLNLDYVLETIYVEIDYIRSVRRVEENSITLVYNEEAVEQKDPIIEVIYKNLLKVNYLVRDANCQIVHLKASIVIDLIVGDENFSIEVVGQKIGICINNRVKRALEVLNL